MIETNKIYNADCLEIMKQIDDNSIDSVVTDPPSGISFMSKKWDTFNSLMEFQDFICEVFKEVYRVLKPGGHGLVWALPRTSHHTAMGLERAGFSIIDCVYHCFGSGFPKSLNIGKAVDKLQGNKREFVKNAHRTTASQSNTSHEYGFGEKTDVNFTITKGTSAFEGFGTALKPAVECWWLIRKPISEKNIAKNVLKWGTGGINIDGSRINIEKNDKNHRPNQTYCTIHHKENYNVNYCSDIRFPRKLSSKGRFPSHLILDNSDEVKECFPMTESGGGVKLTGKGSSNNIKFQNNTIIGKNWEASSGSASRYFKVIPRRLFYCPKPSSEERNTMVGDIMKTNNHTRYGNGLGKTPSVNGIRVTKERNSHPTVKSIKLMRYLITLITPPQGLVLDCFLGSGTTAVACLKDGFRFIGIEKEEKYYKIAQARINHELQNNLFAE